MNLNGKAAEMMIRTAVSALGIDAESLLTNINQFQQWGVNAIKHHDQRLVALEKQGSEISAKLDRLIALLESDKTDAGENGFVAASDALGYSGIPEADSKCDTLAA